MVVSELQYRQKKLDVMFDKYHNGKYDRYYFDGNNIIVFVKELKTRTKKNCANIDGLVLKLNDL
jgi:hypothetical protein